MNPVIRVGIDLAKNTFSLCGVDAREHVVLERSVRRAELLPFFSNLPPCIVAMEAGSGAHHWARALGDLGHDARIIDPGFVATYRQGGRHVKNDRNDARAICEAAGRPSMRFVPIKSPEQQAVLIVHRCRRAAVTHHTRLANQLRGLLAEFGIIVPKGVATLKRQWPELRLRHANRLPLLAWEMLDGLFDQLREQHQLILRYERQVTALSHDNRAIQCLQGIQGVGPLTASAIVATVGNARFFKNGRQFAAWLGLTPREYSTGGRTRPGRISKRGDRYLRTLLVHGARSELMHTAKREDHKSLWAEQIKASRGWNKAAVALANKHARIIWASLADARMADQQPLLVIHL